MRCTPPLPPRTAFALAALALFGAGCKREEAESPAAKALAPYVQWCDAQGSARGSCLVSAARVTGDAATCAKLKGGAPERTACLMAAATTSGRAEVCLPLADRALVLCALGVAAEHGHVSSCEVLENVHWQGGGTRALCTVVARGEPDACPSDTGAELNELCVRFAAMRLRDGKVCLRLGKDSAAVQRCALAVAVARRAPEDCAALFAAAPGSAAQHSCEVEAAVARGRYPPCFSETSLCERFLWVPRACEATSGAWADDCLIHQAVFSTGPLGCGAVRDPKRRALCARLRDAQEGFTPHAPDAGTAPSVSH